MITIKDLSLNFTHSSYYYIYVLIISLKKRLFLLMYTCVYLHVGIHMSADACGGQKKVLDPLKLELQVLGTELGSFTETASA